MIKIDIDLRNATNAQIDSLYGAPGFGEMLRQFQGGDNQYGVMLTIQEPARKKESEGLLSGLFALLRKQQTKAGDPIPEKQFRSIESLGPRQQELLPHLISSLIDAGWFARDGDVYRLTEEGFAEVYNPRERERSNGGATGDGK